MKIVFIGGRNIHTLGGIENYMYNLATQLVKYGHQPIVYCESDHNGVEWCNGFKVIHQKSIGGQFLCKILMSYKATIKTLWSREGVEIYHYNAWPPALASWLPRLFGKKTILQGHGLAWKRTKYSKTQRKIIKFMTCLVVKFSKNLTMVSQEQTEYFAKHLQKHCETIPTATNLPQFPIDSDILSKFQIPTKQYFLYMGRLVQDKNPDYLIKAFIKANIPNKYLVLAGNNNAMPQYVNYLHQLGQGHENIIFTGAVYGADKAKLLENCHAFCIPSTIEGLAITLLEAMSYGKLCIASNIEANKEGLGKSGIWCKYEDTDDLADKLKYSVDHYDDVCWQEEYNKERVAKHFTWDTVARLYNDYLNRI